LGLPNFKQNTHFPFPRRLMLEVSLVFLSYNMPFL